MNGEAGCWESGVVSILGNHTQEKELYVKSTKLLPAVPETIAAKKKILLPRAHHRRHVKVAT